MILDKAASIKNEGVHPREIKVLILSKCKFFCAGFPTVMNAYPDLEFISLTDSMEIFRSDYLVRNNIDVVLIDMDIVSYKTGRLEEAGSLNVIKRLTAFRGISIVALSSSYTLTEAIHLMRLGVKGYINRNISSHLIYRAIHSVISNGVWIDEEFKKYYRNLSAKNDYRGKTPEECLFHSLTTSEQLVIKKMLKGCSVTDIALMSHKSPKTVSGQKQSAMKKLGVKSTIELYKSFGSLIRV